VTGRCPHCGASTERRVEVWQEPQEYERGDPPDFIGCTACHTMDPAGENRGE